ncbi:hypothetical protein HELRODRAFT_184624, partial [Helobdella robusta]|uniref:Uncharacterized protein n=1 Tax=Helobdella robusta TaxID=6412 RepID=T1FLM0_HELRO
FTNASINQQQHRILIKEINNLSIRRYDNKNFAKNINNNLNNNINNNINNKPQKPIWSTIQLPFSNLTNAVVGNLKSSTRYAFILAARSYSEYLLFSDLVLETTK